jgi:hypothetical protein
MVANTAIIVTEFKPWEAITDVAIYQRVNEDAGAYEKILKCSLRKTKQVMYFMGSQQSHLIETTYEVTYNG